MPVRIDLNFDAAIGEDRFRDDGDEVGALHFTADDERGRFVVGIGRSGPDRRDENIFVLDEPAVPLGFEKGHDIAAVGDPLVEERERIAPNDTAVLVGVAVARPGLAVGDVTHYRARIAANLFRSRSSFSHYRASVFFIAASTLWGKAGKRSIRAPVACRIAFRIAGAVGIRTCSPRPRAPIGPSGSAFSTMIV